MELSKMRRIRRDFVEKAEQEIGNVYEWIKITGVSPIRNNGNILHEGICTRCNSGKVRTYRLTYLKKGLTKSCGCYKIENQKEVNRKMWENWRELNK